MRQYEITYLVSDDVLEKDLDNVTAKIAKMISDEEGKILKTESWGRRKLAYPIKKQNFATYVTVWFEVASEKLTALDHEIRVYPQIIRHLITLKIAENEKLAVTTKDVAEIEDVKEILGERSFEVVEGETEESKDLMAKRTVEEDTETEDQKEEIAKPEIKEETKKSKEKKAAKEKPVESKEDEADRMKKLDEKLDQLLGDDL